MSQKIFNGKLRSPRRFLLQSARLYLFFLLESRRLLAFQCSPPVRDVYKRQANYYAAVGLDGFENWYRVQAQEERDHAMLFYQYLQNNGESVTFEAIAKPEWERGDHMTPLKKALEHEKLVTASIDAIYAAAYEAKDFRIKPPISLDIITKKFVDFTSY